MYRRFLKISVLISTIAIVFYSCSKDDNNEPEKAFNGKTTAVFNPDVNYGTMTDQDGNVYKTVTIGTQTWMAENLRTTKYNDGTAIPNVTDNAQWEALTTGSYCIYYNTTNVDNIATYGSLYNWYAVNTGKLAPTGWHVPTDTEWTTLIASLNDVIEKSSKLKEIGTRHWISPNTGATNETGFTALPGGSRSDNGIFHDLGGFGCWWSATENDAYAARTLSMVNEFVNIGRGNYLKEVGFSVRCLMD